MARHWYSYKGPSFDPELAASYRKATIQPGSPPCETGNVICAIYAPSGNITPDSPLSANLLQYINDSILTNVPLPLNAVNKYLFKKNDIRG